MREHMLVFQTSWGEIQQGGSQGQLGKNTEASWNNLHTMARWVVRKKAVKV